MTGSSLSTALCAVFLGAFSIVRQADGNPLTVRIGETELSAGQIVSVVIDSDEQSPDAATVVVTRGPSLPTVGAAMDVATAAGQSIFKGEIVGIEPSVDRASRAVVSIRGLNRLHRLTRVIRTRVFVGQSDAEIVRQLASDAGLSADTSGPEVDIKHEHLYQHNQTDLEFLQERAARIGFELFADETVLYFHPRREAVPVTVGCGPEVALLTTFLARLSSTRGVKEVTVRGWDPVKGEEILGRSRQRVIALSPSAARINPPPSTVDLGFVEPLQSGAASHEVAAGALRAMTLRDVSAEIDARGNAMLRPHALVMLEGLGSAFDGRYAVTQTSHRLDLPSPDGWHTFVRLVRSDRAVYLLPEVGDEVLVAFQGGALTRPIVVGSLWDGSDPPPDSSPCRRER